MTLHHFASLSPRSAWALRRTPLGLLLSDLCHSPSSILDPLQSIFSKAEELAAGTAVLWWISWQSPWLQGGKWDTSLGLVWIGQIELICVEFCQYNSVQYFDMFSPVKTGSTTAFHQTSEAPCFVCDPGSWQGHLGDVNSSEAPFLLFMLELASADAWALGQNVLGPWFGNAWKRSKRWNWVYLIFGQWTTCHWMSFVVSVVFFPHRTSPWLSLPLDPKLMMDNHCRQNQLFDCHFFRF